MSLELQVDTRELRKAMQLYSRATKKDERDIINRAAWSVLVDGKAGVIKTTPRADKEKIERDLMADNLAIKLAAQRLGGSEGKRGKRGGILKNQDWRSRVGKAAKSIISRRKSATSYLKSGWVKAASEIKSKAPNSQDVMRRGRATVTKRFGGANNGEGYAASETRLVAEIVNKSEGITEARGAATALQRAVNWVARDMIKYANKKLAKTAKQYSGK